MSAIVFAHQEPSPAPPAVAQVQLGDFWPALSLDHMREAMRVDQSVTHARLSQAVSAAAVQVTRQLADYCRRHQGAGVHGLAAVPAATINGEPLPVWQYRRAVYCYAMADLSEGYADHAATGNSAERADARQHQADDYRREAHAAIADLLGRPRVDCELI